MPALGREQAALYAAEAVALDHRGVQWRRLSEAQAYLERLLDSAWFFERWPWFVRVRIQRRGRGSVWSTQQPLDAGGPAGSPTEGVILVADGGLTQPTVLHELSHLLLPPDGGHGPRFVETLLTLVRHEMGFFAFAECYQALRRTEGFETIREGVDRDA